MKTADNWREQFKISPAELGKWQASVKNGEDPLHWALVNGRLSENEYYDWAMERFQLPMVTPEFFTIPVDDVFWNRIKNMGKWHMGLIPHAEWDGVLLIGCVEPPRAFTYKGEYRFVLTSARSLQMLWMSLHAAEMREEQKKTETTAVPAKREKPQAPKKKAEPKLDLPDGFAAAAIAEEEDASLSGTDFGAVSNVDAPEGLSNSRFDFDSKSNSEVSEPAAPEFDLPDGMGAPTFNHTNPILAEPRAHTTPAMPMPAAEEAEIVTSVTRNPLQELEELTPVKARVPELPIEPEPQVEVDEEEEFEQPRTRQMDAVEDMKALPLSGAESAEDLANRAVANTLKSFDAGMFLITRGNELRPFKWSPNLDSPRNATLPAVELSTPSIFRIVAKTLRPYHGRVAPSSVNDRFFDCYYDGQDPVSVTVVPVVHDRKLIGMIMGLAGVEMNYKSTLQTMEALADEAGELLPKFPAAKAKAAG